MTIDWLKFLPALLLLLTPGDLFNGGKIRYRDVARDWDGYRSRMLAHGLHSIDLVRAALGTWLLLDALHGPANPHGFAKYAVVLTVGGIRILAVLLQTVICREEDSGNAPFAFVSGLLLGSGSPIGALFAIALALTVAMGSRAPAAYFPVAAFVHLGVGFWFQGKGALIPLGFGAVAAVTPFLWALMFRRSLAVAYRAKPLNTEKHSPLR